LEDLDDPNFPFETPMRPYAEKEIDERLERVSCLLDRLSRGLLEMSRKRDRETDGHDYFTHNVQFLHRSAREYILNTRKAQMDARMPASDVLPRIFRLLLAELKFALPTVHDDRPRVHGVLGVQGGTIMKATQMLLTVIQDAESGYGYNMPSRYFEEASRILHHHTQTPERRIQVRGTDLNIKGLSGVTTCNAWEGCG
jgi:hypothetical protein